MVPIIDLEVMIILQMLLVGMILINIQLLEHELIIPLHMTNLLIAIALLIEVLDTINMVLNPRNLQGHMKRFWVDGHMKRRRFVSSRDKRTSF